MIAAQGFNEQSSMVWLVEGHATAKSLNPPVAIGADSLLESAKVAAKQGRWSDVLVACDKMAEDVKNVLATQRMRARALASMGNVEEALVAWRKVSELAPLATDGHLNIARLERRAGHWAEVLAATRKVLALEPGHTEALSLAGQAFVKHRGAQDGKAIWAGLSSSNADLLRDFQTSLESAERWDEAASALKSLLDAQPTNLTLAQERLRFVEEVLERGKNKENFQDFTGASLTYRSVLIVDPGNGEATRLLQKMTRPLIAAGREKLKERDYATAGQFFTECLTYEPAEMAALIGMGRVFDALTDWKQAEETWGKVTAQDPGNETAWLRLGIACGRNQNFEKGIAAFQNIKDPEQKTVAADAVSRLALAAFKAARTLYLSSEFLKASQVLALAEDHLGTDDNVRGLREKISKTLRNLQQAAQETRDMARVAELGQHIVIGRKTDVSAWTVYARALFAQKQMMESLAAWQHVVQLDPHRAEAVIGVARAHFALGQHEACIVAVQSVLETDPANAKAAEVLQKAQLALTSTKSVPA